MVREIRRFLADESGAYLVETIITIAILILVGGPILLTLLNYFVNREDGVIFILVDFIDSLLAL